MSQKKEMLYEGKAKQVFATDKPDEVVVRSKMMLRPSMHKNVDSSIEKAN